MTCGRTGEEILSRPFHGLGYVRWSYITYILVFNIIVCLRFQMRLRIFIKDCVSPSDAASLSVRLSELSHFRTTEIAVSEVPNSNNKSIDNINNKPIWLEDISTYPIIAICTGACVGAGAYIGYKSLHPDVRVDKNKRGSEIRWWGDDKAQLRLQK